MPVSLTTRRALERERLSFTSTRPPSGVNLIALARRLPTTCWRRPGSPETGSSDASTT